MNVRPLLRHPRAYDPSFGPAGERLAFVYEATGDPQAFVLSTPDAWPRPLTAIDDRVIFAKWSPARPVLVVGTAPPGEESVAYHRLDADGSTPLTDAPEATHRWGGWSHGGDRFAFTANRRDPSAFDVYVRDVDDESADLVYEGDGWFDVLGWSPDDGSLAVRRTRSASDVDLFRLSLPDGEVGHVTPPEEARYRSVNWGPEGQALYLVTDYEADTSYVARLDLESGDLAPVLDGGDWNVDGINLHAPSGRFVYGLNVDGYSEFRAGRLTGPTETEALSVPETPDGVMGEVAFAPSGERVAMTVSTRAAVPNVYVVDLSAGTCQRWTGSRLVGLADRSLVRPTVIRYESFDGLEVPALLSVPADADGPRPAVVDLHGGPEKQRRPDFSGRVQAFLDAGYVVLEPNVRGSAGYGAEYAGLDDGRNRPDVVEDVRAGTEWLADHHAVDPDRVALFGSSYGGYLALLAATTYPDRWAGVVEVAGITDLLTFLENTSPSRRPLRVAEYGSPEDDSEFLAEISPVNRAADLAVPLLAVHGENDARVPVEETLQFVEAAREAGAEVESHVLEDEAHTITDAENRVRVQRWVQSFLDRTIGDAA